jgi:hypothetical protein
MYFCLAFSHFALSGTSQEVSFPARIYSVAKFDYPHSTRNQGDISPATTVAIPSMMKIHLHPDRYMPSPTRIKDRAYATIGPKPEESREAM